MDKGALEDLLEDPAKQTVNEAPFVARLIAPLVLEASPYAILAWPTVEMFGSAYKLEPKFTPKRKP